ncbi:MAG: 4Fe-4S binding protein, partial [bacterium]|nr:4Fe-4S binding protein [bacterium]
PNENQPPEIKPIKKKKEFSIEVNLAWCKACGICIAFCPTKVYDTDSLTAKPITARPQDCIGCMLCEIRCPDFAIEVREKNLKK